MSKAAHRALDAGAAGAGASGADAPRAPRAVRPADAKRLSGHAAIPKLFPGVALADVQRYFAEYAALLAAPSVRDEPAADAPAADAPAMDAPAARAPAENEWTEDEPADHESADDESADDEPAVDAPIAPRKGRPLGSGGAKHRPWPRADDDSVQAALPAARANVQMAIALVANSRATPPLPPAGGAPPTS